MRASLGDCRDGDGDGDGDGHNCAFFTLEILVSTPRGVTSPITVTFFVGKSMINEATPEIKYTTKL